MELQTVVQVSKTFGISARMLRYYEQVGLIESTRTDDYAYRVYDESAIKRLQQIIILRKLQIPIKQISEILKNQDAVTVIEVFKQNISELDEKITALSAVKSILTRFIDELQEKADVHLKLDLLNDKTMINLVDALSIPISRVKEKVSMEELNKASETLNEEAYKNVRIIYMPPMTVASAGFSNTNNLHNAEYLTDPFQKLSATAMTLFKEFADEVDLFTIKPDTRIFGGGNERQNKNGHWEGDYDIWASIPDDLDVPPPLTKRQFYGGLYATCTDGQILAEWQENTEDYRGDNGGICRPAMHEYFNMYNRHNLRKGYSEENGYSYIEPYAPIKEIKKLTNAEKEQIRIKWNELDKTTSQGKTTNIDFKTMVKQTENEAYYENGLMILHRKESWNIRMATQEHFSCPLKIELRAKISDQFLDLGYADEGFSMNWCGKGLAIGSGKYDENNVYPQKGKIPVNEFIDIEFILGRECMAIKVNGELRYSGIDHGYIKAFENPKHKMSGAVYVGTEFDNTLTVETLRITEL